VSTDPYATPLLPSELQSFKEALGAAVRITRSEASPHSIFVQGEKYAVVAGTPPWRGMRAPWVLVGTVVPPHAGFHASPGWLKD
jgi:hypothetical protein